MSSRRKRARPAPDERPLASEPARSDKRLALVLALVLAVATLAVFARTLGAEFITADDPVYVSQNPTVSAGLTAAGVRWAFGFHDGNWIPATWMSLMLDASLFGVGPAGFHRTNVILHLASVLLLYGALSRMTGRAGPGAFVALLFAIHPLHVESVAWVAERKDALSGLFWMAGLVAWDSYVRRPSVARYAIVAALLAAGLAAKPMLVSLPLVYFLLDLWPLSRAVPAARLAAEKIPLLALSAASAILTATAQRAEGAMSSLAAIPLSERIGNAIVSYALYLGKAILPTGLAFFYPHPGSALPAWQVVVAAAVLAALTIGAWRERRAHPYLAVGWAWYVITLVPVIGLVQVGIQSRADRYTYLTLIGPFLAVTWLAAEWIERVPDAARRRVLAWGAAIAAGAPLAAAAYVQAGYWHDSVTLYTHALAVTERNAVAHEDLATALLAKGDLDGAAREAREALSIAPGHPEPPVTLATVLSKQGRTAEAIAVYREALKMRPGDATLHSNLGTILGGSGDAEGAATEFREAIRLAPGSSDAHYNLGALLAQQGRYEAAIPELETAQRLSPFDADIKESLETARKLAAAPSAPGKLRP